MTADQDRAFRTLVSAWTEHEDRKHADPIDLAGLAESRWHLDAARLDARRHAA